MICPYCASDQSACVDSRQLGMVRDRRYKCLSCGERYNTREKLRSDVVRTRDISAETERILNGLEVATRGAQKIQELLEKELKYRNNE